MGGGRPEEDSDPVQTVVKLVGHGAGDGPCMESEKKTLCFREANTGYRMRQLNNRREGMFAIIAAFFVLFSALIDPIISCGAAVKLTIAFMVCLFDSTRKSL
jgi:hypothetical protein